MFTRYGNFDRSWSTPTGNYPIAFNHPPYWSKEMLVMVYDSSSTFNPKTIGGKANGSFYANSADVSGNFSNYAYVTYHTNLTGAASATETRWVDATKRHHAVYDAAWPTNVGLDVRLRAHQFSGPNWNNLNDFVIVEISFKNNGNVDMDMNGTPEITNHKIQGVTVWFDGEFSPSIDNNPCGRRCNTLWCTTPARDNGYIGDDDPNASPWAFTACFEGTTAKPPVLKDMGLNPYAWRYYTDIFSGFTYIGAKKGGIPADISKGTGKNVDKPLVWGTPAIGTGAQRGWYMSAGTGQGLGLFSLTDPKTMFNASIGTYYKNGGKDNIKANMDLNPNTKFFSSGKLENIMTWVPKTLTPTAAERPNGDRKLLSEEATQAAAFYQGTDYLDGKADANTPYPTGFGTWSKGYINSYNYDGDLFMGIGPFSLDVGEEMTVSFLLVAGYRLEGIQKSVRAGRYAYENDYVIPEPPPVPDMKVANTAKNSVLVEWDKRAENDAQFAGYKIWRSSQFIKYSWLTDGMRLIDKYQEQMTPGEDKAAYRKPINPYFNAQSDVAAASTKGQYSGAAYGTWELMKTIPKAEINNYNPVEIKKTNPLFLYTSSTGYTYLLEDKNVVSGFSYWYYVSAYKEGTYTGPGGETTTRLETHSLNRNGATGLWIGTFPFANTNPAWPTTAAGLKDIGAVQVVYSALIPAADLNLGKVQVGVKPNPYKRAALHDNFTNVYDHKILFYNLPSSAKITITDVAGKIIDIINFTSTDPNKGATFWDMFSKDGMEVASGLYLYFVEWSGGSAKGKFAIIK
jgi:hypothetical protein